MAVGDSTRLEIIFNTGSYKNAVTKSPVIMTNEGPQKYTPKISATIFTSPDSTYPIRILPSTINFADTGETQVTEYYFSIINISQQNVKPVLISYPKALVSLNLPDIVEAGNSADASIKLTNMGQRKNFEKSVTIELNDPERTRYTIPIGRGSAAATRPAGNSQSSH